jgi:hypothetical protein
MKITEDMVGFDLELTEQAPSVGSGWDFHVLRFELKHVDTGYSDKVILVEKGEQL